MLDHSAGALQGYPLKQRITAGTNMCVDSILCQPRCWLVDTHGLLHVLEKHVKTLLKASVALERLSEGCVALHACRYRAPFKRSQTLWPPSVPSQSGYFKFFAIRESIEASDFEKLNSEGAVSLMLRSLACHAHTCSGKFQSGPSPAVGCRPFFVTKFFLRHSVTTKLQITLESRADES